MLVAAALFAAAQDCPNKPVHLLVPFAAGSSADVYAAGQRLRPGAGNAQQPAGEQPRRAAGGGEGQAGRADVCVVGGSSGARIDVLGGQVDMMFDALPTMTEHVRAGKVKAIATTDTARSAVMPDVPAMAETGVANYEATLWPGVMAPQGTPPAIAARLDAEISKITANPEVVRAWRAEGTAPLVMHVAEVTRTMNDDIVKRAQIVKVSGAKPEQ